MNSIHNVIAVTELTPFEKMLIKFFEFFFELEKTIYNIVLGI